MRAGHLSLAKIKTLCSMLALLALVACSSNQVRVEPTKLTSIDAQVRIKKLWAKQIGSGGGESGAAFVPAIHQDTIFANDSHGLVLALERESGKRRWKVNLRQDLVGGLATDGDLLWVTSREGRVIALDTDDGAKVWSSQLPSEALAPAAVSGEFVVVQTQDGRLTCLDRRSGEQIWVTGIQVPVLSLRGSARPVIESNQVIAGFASGKLASFDLKTGQLQWVRQVGQSSGAAELENLVDVDGDFVVDRGAVIASAYHGGLMALSVRNGQPYWLQPVSSHQSLAVGFDTLFVADSLGVIHGYDLRSGDPRWTLEALKAREPSGGAVIKDWLLVADFEGYVHLLDQLTGEQLGRYRVDGSPVRVTPLVEPSDDTAYVMSTEGKLVALSFSVLNSQ